MFGYFGVVKSFFEVLKEPKGILGDWRDCESTKIQCCNNLML